MTDFSQQLVRVAVALSPHSYRQTRSEQWLADVRDARELDLAPAEVALGALLTALLHRRVMHRSSWGEHLTAITAPSAHTVCTRPLVIALAFASALFGVVLLSMAGRYQSSPLLNLVLLFAFALIVFVPTVAVIVVIALTRGAPVRQRVVSAVVAVVALAIYYWGFIGASPWWLWEAIGVGILMAAWLFLLRRPRLEWFLVAVPPAVAPGAGAIISTAQALGILNSAVAVLASSILQLLPLFAVVLVGSRLSRRGLQDAQRPILEEPQGYEKLAH